jgi:hypothetical protein
VNDQTNQEAAPDIEVTVTIRELDYEFVVKCLNAARELLITEGVGNSARVEIDWALVGLGQDIPA